MPQRVISLLHVEDDLMQRQIVQHHLAVMEDYQFNVHFADSEEVALEIFGGGRTEFVILDYQLRQGNGLNCLKVLRERDPMVPVIAISGAATPEVALELLQAGADDYLSKRELTSGLLARSIREALLRTDACRPRISGHSATPGGRAIAGES